MTLKTLIPWVVCASMAGALPACDGAKSAAPADDVEKAATIAKEIKASPDDAEKVLEKHSMTEEQFEALMFEIAEDPKKAEAFAEKTGT